MLAVRVRLLLHVGLLARYGVGGIKLRKRPKTAATPLNSLARGCCSWDEGKCCTAVARVSAIALEQRKLTRFPTLRCVVSVGVLKSDLLSRLTVESQSKVSVNVSDVHGQT